MISKTPEDLQYYEARMKFLHDQEARLIAAREEGLEKGREEGRREGLAGKVQLLQELLGDDPTELNDLLTRSSQELEALASQLHQRARDRS